MSATDVQLLVAALVAVGGALTAWLKADAAVKQAQSAAAKVADLTVANAVHETKINGLLSVQVHAIMAPSMAAAAQVAAQALADHVTSAQNLPAPPSGVVGPTGPQVQP